MRRANNVNSILMLNLLFSSESHAILLLFQSHSYFFFVFSRVIYIVLYDIHEYSDHEVCK